MIKQRRKAFTLVEVIISITLLSLVLMALYKSADILRDSNLHLFKHLEKSSNALKGSRTLYMDLMHADHNITVITEEKFHMLTIEHTTHSLYGQGAAKVTWLVAKEDNVLLRVEGGSYTVPLRGEQRVEIDVVSKDIEMFKVYKSKKRDKVLAIIQIKGQEPQTFMVQNIPLRPVNTNSTNKNKLNNPNNPNNQSQPKIKQ